MKIKVTNKFLYPFPKVFCIAGIVYLSVIFFTILAPAIKHNLMMQNNLSQITRNWNISDLPWGNYFQYLDISDKGFAEECPNTSMNTLTSEMVEDTFQALYSHDTSYIMETFNLARCADGSNGYFDLHYRFLAQANGQLLLANNSWQSAVDRMLFAQTDYWPIRKKNKLIFATLCTELIQKQQWQGALTVCVANEQTSSNFFSAIALGRTLSQLGQYEQALVLFSVAKERNTTAYEPYYWSGVIYNDLGLLDEAVFNLEKAFSFNTDSCDVLFELGLAYFFQGNQEAFNFTLENLNTLPKCKATGTAQQLVKAIGEIGN
ncbi:MAG: tetratricopeptide repeat protein [Ardenticatenaceae bacterium]|nr:tetratricopeptide repeat protein [Ardenticatenaceae bacterium]MCB9005494.1 tetratricopeptide repeat protein [Ardenticatenaceae bacterium]